MPLKDTLESIKEGYVFSSVENSGLKCKSSLLARSGQRQDGKFINDFVK